MFYTFYNGIENKGPQSGKELSTKEQAIEGVDFLMTNHEKEQLRLNSRVCKIYETTVLLVISESGYQ